MFPQPPASSSDRSPGILGAILGNPTLRRKLDKLSPDAQTMTLSLGEDGENFHWRVGDVDSREFETIQFDFDASEKGSENSVPYVPRRRMATLADKCCDDVDYRIIGKLGSGGTGIVYQAHQRAIDREVALKVLRSDLSTRARARDRFLTEAKMIGALDHPNVIALHEVFMDEKGDLVYSMKRIDGTSWDKQIRELSLHENLNILLRAADAIRYAHSRGLIHRDIKPENVMLGRFGEVLMADWGLAISHDGNQSSDGIPPAIGGTPAYMAPEQARGAHRDISFQTDVYLLGAALFEILAGFPPHRGSSLLSCLHAAAHNEIRETELEGELMEIAKTSMETDPTKRFQSVEAMIAAINNFRQHEESDRLVRRAMERISESSGDHQYQDFRVAEALLMEALQIWPDNRHARKSRRSMQIRFAETAAERGDLDLAVSLYDAAGESESPAAKKVRDIRDARDANHEQISRYSALFTHSPDAGLLLHMASGNVVESNPMFRELFGYRQEDVVGKKIAELILWACPKRREQLVEQLRTKGSIDNFEAVFLRTDGQPVDVLISGRVVELLGEEMVVSTIRDVTRRKQAESELGKSRERLRELQRLAGLGTWSYDVHSGEVTWSEEAFRLAGRPIEQGVPSKEEYLEMIHPEDREPLKQAMRTSVESGAAFEIVARQRDALGNYQRLLMRGQPIFDAQGKTTEVYGVLLAQKN